MEQKNDLKHYQRRRRSVHPTGQSSVSGPLYGLYPEPHSEFQHQHQHQQYYPQQYQYPTPQHHVETISETPGARFDTPVASPPIMIRQYLPPSQSIPLQPALRMLPSSESVEHAGAGRRLSPPERKPVDYSKLAANNSPTIPSPHLHLDPSMDPRFSSNWARHDNTSVASSPYDEETFSDQRGDRQLPFVPSVLQSSTPPDEELNKRNTAVGLQEFVFPISPVMSGQGLNSPSKSSPPRDSSLGGHTGKPKMQFPGPPVNSPPGEVTNQFQTIIPTSTSAQSALAVPKTVRNSMLTDSSGGSTSSTTSSMGQQIPPSQQYLPSQQHPSSSLAGLFATSSNSSTPQAPNVSTRPLSPKKSPAVSSPGQTFGNLPASQQPKPQVFVRMGDGRLVRKLSTIGSVGTEPALSGDEEGKKRRRDSSDVGGYSSEEESEIHFPSLSTPISRNFVSSSSRPLSGSSSQLDSIAEQQGLRVPEVWLNDTSDEGGSRSLELTRPGTSYSADDSEAGLGNEADVSTRGRKESIGNMFGGWWTSPEKLAERERRS